MDPTPNNYKVAGYMHQEHPLGNDMPGAYLQSRKHLAFLLTVDQAVVVLHRNEWREIVRDGVVCINCGQSTGERTERVHNVLCI